MVSIVGVLREMCFPNFTCTTFRLVSEIQMVYQDINKLNECHYSKDTNIENKMYYTKHIDIDASALFTLVSATRINEKYIFRNCQKKENIIFSTCINFNK